MKKNKKLIKLILCSLFTALGVGLLWIGGALGDMDLTIAAVASLLILIIIIEINSKYALLVYMATSALSLILFAGYFITVIYSLFVGIYPILKFLFEKTGKIVSLLLKLVFMNVMLTALIFIGKKLFGIEEDMLIWLVYILSNVCFLLFDYVLTKLKDLYLIAFQKRLGINKLLK